MKYLLAAVFLTAVLLLILSRAGFLRGPRADVSTVRSPIAPAPQALEIGSLIYQQNCAICHGADGAGHGPAAADLNPQPADLRVHTAMGHTDGQLFRSISNGVAGTAMPAFRSKLSEEERWYVITFIRSTFTPTEK